MAELEPIDHPFPLKNKMYLGASHAIFRSRRPVVTDWPVELANCSAKANRKSGCQAFQHRPKPSFLAEKAGKMLSLAAASPSPVVILPEKQQISSKALLSAPWGFMSMPSILLDDLCPRISAPCEFQFNFGLNTAANHIGSV